MCCLRSRSTAHQCANNQRGWRSVRARLVVLPLGDDIPLLVGCARTVHQRNRYQVLAEVARRRVDEEALPVGCADRDLRECPCGCLIALVRLSRRGRLQSAAGPRHGDGFGRVHRRDSPRPVCFRRCCRRGLSGRDHSHRSSGSGAGRGRLCAVVIVIVFSIVIIIIAVIVVVAIVVPAVCCGATDGERLIGVVVVTVGDVDRIPFDNETSPSFILWLQRERSSSTVKSEELRSGHLAA